MRRIFLSIFGVLLPLTVHAASVSPWVDRILTKADLGITTSEGVTNDPVSDEMHATIKDQLLSDVRVLIDTHNEVSRFADEQLFNRTTCFSADISAMDAKIALVHTKLVEALEAKKDASVGVLKSVLSFLTNARRSLVFGGLNPSYDDQMFSYDASLEYPFESVALWENHGQSSTSPPAPQGPLCPFTTDYLPHQVLNGKSYGCDISVLTQLNPVSGTEAFYIKQFLANANIFIEQVSNATRTFSDTFARSIAKIRGAPATSLPAPIPYITNPPHEVLSGCLKPEIPTDLRDAPELNDAYDYTTDESEYTPPTNILPQGIFLQNLHDSFSVSVNDARLMDLYQRVKLIQGRNRGIPVIAGLETVITLLDQAAINVFMPKFQNLSGNISQEEGYLDLLGRDTPRRINTANSLLTQATQRMALVADTVLPTYVRDLAYFLRRQCVDGPCKERLETSLKRIMNPYCHPYTSGQYADRKTVDYCYCKDPSMPNYNRLCTSNFQPATFESYPQTMYPAACVLSPQRPTSVEEFLQNYGIRD